MGYQVSAAKDEGNGERWEPNTYVDGVNVGGKFKPKDGQGVVKNPAKTTPDKPTSLSNILNRAKQLSKGVETNAADAIAAMGDFGKALDSGGKELQEKIRDGFDEARISSQIAFLNSMYDLGILEPPPPPPKSFSEVLTESGQNIFSSIEECVNDPEKIKDVMGEAVTIAQTQGSMLGPEILMGIVWGSTMPEIIAGFFAYQAVSAVVDKVKESQGIDPEEEDPLSLVGQDLILMLASHGLAEGITHKMSSGAKIGSKIAKGKGKIDQTIGSSKVTAKSLLDKSREVKDSIVGYLKSKSTKEIHRTPAKQQQSVGLDIVSKDLATEKPAAAHLATSLAAYSGQDSTHPIANTKSAMKMIRDKLNHPDLVPSLKEHNIDPAAIKSRLLEMAQIDSLPLHHRENRMKDISRLVQRITELPDANKVAKGLDADRIDSIFLGKVDKETAHLDPATRKMELISAESERGNLLEKTHGAKWRATSIQAEIEHGPTLDKILHSSSIEESSTHLDSLRKSLVKNQEKVDTEFVGQDGLVQKLRSISPTSFKDILTRSYKMATKKHPEGVKIDPEKIANQIQEISKMSANPISQKVSFATTANSRPFSLKDFLELGDGSERVLYHEVGHIIEKENKEIYRRNSAFRSSRSGKTNQLTDLGGNMAGEKIVKDDFERDYIGKIYPSLANATEVMSCGMESLADVRKAISHGSLDREHLMLVLGNLGVK